MRSERPPITAQGAMPFGTVAVPILGRRPTLGLRSAPWWEMSIRKAASDWLAPHRCTKRHRPYGTYALPGSERRTAHIAGYALPDVLITRERRITDFDPGDRGFRLDVGDPQAADRLILLFL
jgi:hypothetical protein